MLDEPICHFTGNRSILSLLFYFRWKILVANNVEPDQMPHDVASDQGLHCLPMTQVRMGYSLSESWKIVTMNHPKQQQRKITGKEATYRVTLP